MTTGRPVLCYRIGCQSLASRRHPIFNVDVCGKHTRNKKVSDFAPEHVVRGTDNGSVTLVGKSRVKLGPQFGSHIAEPREAITIINPVKWCGCGEPIRPIYEQCGKCFNELDRAAKTPVQQRLWRKRYHRYNTPVPVQAKKDSSYEGAPLSRSKTCGGL